MTLQGYLLGLKISTLFAFSAWASVVLYVDPGSAGVFGKGLFFVTLFLWLAGALTLLLTWLQKRIFDDECAAGSLGSNMRQSAFASGLALSLLGLQYFKVLAFWNGLLIAVVFLLIELHFIHEMKKDCVVQNVKPKSQQKYSRLRHKGVI